MEAAADAVRIEKEGKEIKIASETQRMNWSVTSLYSSKIVRMQLT